MQDPNKGRLPGAEDILEMAALDGPTIILMADLESWRPDAGTGEQLTYVSPNVERVLGFRPEEIVGVQSWWAEHVHPDDLPSARDVFNEAASAGSSDTSTQYRVRNSEGEYRWLDTTLRLGFDSEERPAFVIGFAFDVTARKEAEEACREIFDSAAEGIASTTPDGRFLRANPALARMAGFDSPEEFLDANPSAFGLYGEPALREEFMRLIERDGEVRGFETRGPGSPAEAPWITISAHAVRDERGEIIRIDGILQDITKRRRAEEALQESEERFRLLSDATLEGIAIHQGGQIIDANRAFCEMFGYGFEEVVGMSALDLTAPESSAVVSEQLREPRDEPYEAVCLRKDGSAFLARLAGRDIPYRGERARVAAVRDITEQRRAEEELRRTVVLLEEIMEERRRLLARLADVQEEERRRLAADIHDDPIQKMTAAGLRLETLRRRLSDSGDVGVLDQLQESIGLAIERLRHLLFELRPPALDREGLSAALDEYLEQLTEGAELRARVENHLTSEPPAASRVVAYRIAQEALSNVRKHSHARSVNVLLEPKDGGVLMRISDDGIGFEHAERGVRNPGHLGLSTMRERAELAGGSFRVGAEPGRGTTVEVWLPVAEWHAT